MAKKRKTCPMFGWTESSLLPLLPPYPLFSAPGRGRPIQWRTETMADSIILAIAELATRTG